jgi:glycosyltransferase involved in cell wall biosynthesis
VKSLRIAQLVLPWIPLPPPGYAGTERVVYHLTEGLVKRGHEVTLFSVGESKTSAKLEAILPKALGLQQDVKAAQAGSFYPLMHVAHCFEMADQFDIIHSHAQFLGLPFAASVKTPSLHTFHRIFEFTSQDETDLVTRYGKLNFASISNAQRIEGINYLATVYNGVDTSVYKPTDRVPTRDYLFWAGRMIDKKGPLEAIQVAQKVGMNLVMAGEVTEPAYFEQKIKPHIDGVKIQLAQHENREHLIDLYQHAKATIVPTKWTEPFGLVPVESMACGTPAVSFDRGGVAETIADGTGFLVKEEEGVDGLARRVKQIMDLSPDQYADMTTKARNHVEEHFSVDAMVSGYEAVYDKILGATS